MCLLLVAVAVETAPVAVLVGFCTRKTLICQQETLQ
jgi:hypothetical protein